jgi:hypothetical protein
VKGTTSLDTTIDAARKPAKPSKPISNQVCRDKFWAEKANIKDSHPHIVEWFDNKDRALQTDIIDGCFKKGDGFWKLDLEKPFFKESKKKVCVQHGSLYRTLDFKNLESFHLQSFRIRSRLKYVQLQLWNCVHLCGIRML